MNTNVVYISRKEGDSLDELYNLICAHLQRECLSEISYDTGISYSTLWRWREGLVTTPFLPNLVLVATYFGYQIYWRRS